MRTLNLIQGSPEWAAHRATTRNASDAPAMMGLSSYKTRAQLIREVATGITPEIDAGTEARFADGHRFEALARPIAEQIIGEDLYPVTGVSDCGRYGASFDGLTMGEDTAFEHKTLNESLRAALRDVPEYGADLPEQYRVQMEQQCMVSGAERVLFMASKWDGDTLVEELHAWYVPDPALRARIIAAWEQFDADVAAYVPEPVKAEVVAAPVAGFGTLSLRVEGRVLASNLDAFRADADAFIERLPRPADLQSDQDFADAEAAVKACGEAESRIKSAREAALAQMADVDSLLRTAESISETIRAARLALEKAVKAEKENRRLDIVNKARAAWTQHITDLTVETKGVGLQVQAPDFAGAIKGKRTLSSMQDACDTALAQAKIAANESARHIRAALACLSEETEGQKHLFPDYQSFVHKPIDDIRALVRGRIAEHKQREEAKLEADRERIRAEEAARLEREQRERDEQARKAAEPAPEPAPVPVSKGKTRPAPAKTRPTDDEIIDAISLHFRVHESKVIEWLFDVDLNAASQRLVA
ncbi:YqaJ viral recombinase family protein [Arenimonas alkanexedens]